MRSLVAVVVALGLGCSAGGEREAPRPMLAGGAGQGGAHPGSAGAVSVAGAGVVGGSGGTQDGDAAVAGFAGHDSTSTADACPQIKACTEKCMLMAPGPIMAGLHCSIGNFSCGDVLGYYASDGTEWVVTYGTATEVSRVAIAYCVN